MDSGLNWGCSNFMWNSLHILLQNLMKWVVLKRKDFIHSSADDVIQFKHLSTLLTYMVSQ